MRTYRALDNNQLIGSVPEQWSTLTLLTTCAPHRPHPASLVWLKDSGSYHLTEDNYIPHTENFGVNSETIGM
jgi:hypothetical protein